jgi:hypothetical protein
MVIKKTFVKAVDETCCWFRKTKSLSLSDGVLHSPEKPACEE